MSLARRSDAAELMDSDCTDAADYARCLHDLAQVNTATLARWPTLAWLDRAMQRRAPGEGISVYDVAFGHGDMLRTIARWGRRRGRPVSLFGVDMNPGAVAAARAASPGLAMDLQTGDVLATTPDPAPDYIVSSLFTHHLTDSQVVAFLRWMEQHARYGWFINDLHRHALPYHGFRLLARTMRWHRFVQHDGPVSIARAFKRSEWESLLERAGVPGTGTMALPVPPVRGPAALSPVVIAGGGLAGAAAACCLARAGGQVTVLERERGPAHKVCGEFLSGEALSDLAELGIDVTSLGAAPITAMRLVHRGRVAQSRLPFPASGLSRLVLDQALLRRAAELGAEIQCGIRVRSAAPGLLQTDAGPIAAPTLLLATGKHELRGLPRAVTSPPESLIGFKLHLRLHPGQMAALARACRGGLVRRWLRRAAIGRGRDCQSVPFD